MTECNHRYAYAGMVRFKTLVIEVFVCEACESVRVEKFREPNK